MVEAINLIYGANSFDESPQEESMLHELFTKLFTGRGIEFFDAEPDEEFLSIFDGARKLTVEERKRVLEDFKKELMLEKECFGEYGKMNEILIQSEDFVDNIKVPFLMFNLCDDEDIKDPSYTFNLDLFDVFHVGDDHFVVVLYAKNTSGNHMEIYLRLEREEASRVVKTLLKVFEEYMGCDGAEPPCHSSKDGCLEEMYTQIIQRYDETQLRPTKEVSEIGLRKFSDPDINQPRFGA
jgi:hypothetical protein